MDDPALSFLSWPSSLFLFCGGPIFQSSSAMRWRSCIVFILPVGQLGPSPPLEPTFRQEKLERTRARVWNSDCFGSYETSWFQHFFFAFRPASIIIFSVVGKQKHVAGIQLFDCSEEIGMVLLLYRGKVQERGRLSVAKSVYTLYSFTGVEFAAEWKEEAACKCSPWGVMR